MGVHRILPALRPAVEAYHRRIPTGELNRAVPGPPGAPTRRPGSRIRYAVQGAIDPPTFTLFATRRLNATYLRYVERKLREEFALGPTPIKIRVRLRGLTPVMPWCDSCDRVVEDDELTDDGDCPTARSRWSSAPVPWHFKFLLFAATVIYLGWRAYQGIGWLVHHA